MLLNAGAAALSTIYGGGYGSPRFRGDDNVPQSVLSYDVVSAASSLEYSALTRL